MGPVRTGLKEGGAYRQYQRGFVVYSPSTGAQVSRGAIRTAYGKLGYEKGRLGYPTMLEAGIAGVTFQKYQGETISLDFHRRRACPCRSHPGQMGGWTWDARVSGRACF
ncbi:LGFP repeat-containing protein [Arthrobacter globiformis]|uniref:LGFP repeat-containing protein n=1 Tax=Arthrobacter globiformis TaxID=1665 RepID=UPI00358E4F4B